MENAADALILAVDMLIFIVALTLCISSFSNVRQGVDNIINRTETIKMAKDSEGYINYIQSNKSKATRVVGIDTLVPSLYRAIKENYVVYIKLKNSNWPNSIESVTAIRDLKIDGSNIINEGDTLYKFTIGSNENIHNKIKTNISLFSTLTGNEFYEYLGEYQLDNLTNSEDRTTYRIITYVEK